MQVCAVSELNILNKNYSPKYYQKDKLANEFVSNYNSDNHKHINQKLYGAYLPNISFNGSLNSEQRKKCHMAIHGASATCAAISAAMGEGAVVGADTLFLRGTQALMFFYLKNLLNIDMWANLQYMGRQYVIGEQIGVHGAKAIIGWLGLGGHIATGGTASPIVTTAVRMVNASLSTAITEKMGWGYVSSYENDSMTAKRQLLANALYFAGYQLVGHIQDHAGLLDPSNIGDIKEAIEKLPKEHVSLFGDLMTQVSKYVNVPRTGIMFLTSLVQGAITTNNMDEKSKKEIFKQLVGVMLLNSVIYEALNLTDSASITNETIQTVHELGEKIKNTPEVFQEFTKAQQEMIDKLNIDKMDTKDFIKQFKNKKFSYNIAVTSGELSGIVAEKWRKRNFIKLKTQRAEVNNHLNQAGSKSDRINADLSDEDKIKMQNDFNEIVEQTKADFIKKGRNNHSMNRIAGYDGTKSMLNMIYIEPVKKKLDSVPNSILFYGPSGLGKTALGPAMAEEVGARFRKEDIGFRSEEKQFEKIMSFMENSQQMYDKDGRYSVLQLNEADGFLNDNPQLREKFVKLLKECSSKYHASIFLTTNNPLNIHKDILENINILTPIEPAGKDDIKSIVKHYVNNMDIKDYNIDDIVYELEKTRPNSAYSNAQIENIIVQKLPKNPTQKDIIEIIKSTKPAIGQEVMVKFENEKNKLRG